MQNTPRRPACKNPWARNRKNGMLRHHKCISCGYTTDPSSILQTAGSVEFLQFFFISREVETVESNITQILLKYRKAFIKSVKILLLRQKIKIQRMLRHHKYIFVGMQPIRAQFSKPLALWDFYKLLFLFQDEGYYGQILIRNQWKSHSKAWIFEKKSNF